MSKVIVKKDKPKKNDGGPKPFGVDLDPKKDLVHITNDDGSTEAFYKGTKMVYDDYISELESRTDRNKKGKAVDSASIGLFSGWRESKS